MSKTTICVRLMFYGLAATERFPCFPVIPQSFSGIPQRKLQYPGLPNVNPRK